ncbi:DMT family transporter [Candidatus Darwinibacter acetoxidans]
MGAFARWSALSPLELSFFRLVSATLALFFLLPREQRFSYFYTKEYLLISIAGLLFALDTIFYFNAFQLTTLGNAVLPYNMQPVFMALLSPLILKERADPRNIFLFVLSLLGVGIMLLPCLLKLSYTDAAGIGFSLGGAFCLSLVALIARHLQMNAIIFVYYTMFTASLILLPFFKFAGRLGLKQLVIAAVVGLIHTALAYVLYYDSLRTIRIEHVVTLSYLIPVVAALTGLLIFREPLNLHTILGGLLIIASGLILIFRS